MTLHKKLAAVALIAATALALTAAAPAPSAAPAPASSQQKPSLKDFQMGRDMEILFNLFREVNMLYVDPTDPDKLLANAAEGMTSQLDPYTEYISAEDMVDFEVMTTGKYAGIGSLIRKKGDYIAIAQPYKGFPADKAGLKVGDKIMEVNGRDVAAMTVSEVSAALKGDPGSTVKLKVQKFGTGDVVNLVIRRERIAISGIPYSGYVEDGIGYIRHDDFTEDCANDMHKALDALKRSGQLKGLVIDLRNNGGGILQEAVKILSLYLPKGTEVVSMRGKMSEMDATFRTESDPVEPTLPIVVLVNGNSASAAEIVSGSLQDLDRAVLMGQRTFGKGLVQSTRPIGYNAYLKVTTAKYYIPSGRCIQAIDYTHRRTDGSVGYVPDSLVKEFHTAAGRKVYDGGGVTPDVKIDAPSYISRFVVTVYSRGFIEDFVDSYILAHPGLQAPARTFALGEAGYNEFKTFMKGTNMEFESETQVALRQLTENAGKERSLDKISSYLEQMQAALPSGIGDNLELYRDDLTRLIESEIVMRYNYIQGSAERDMSRDPEVAAAAALLKDPARYHALLEAK